MLIALRGAITFISLSNDYFPSNLSNISCPRQPVLFFALSPPTHQEWKSSQFQGVWVSGAISTAPATWWLSDCQLTDRWPKILDRTDPASNSLRLGIPGNGLPSGYQFAESLSVGTFGNTTLEGVSKKQDWVEGAVELDAVTRDSGAGMAHLGCHEQSQGSYTCVPSTLIHWWTCVAPRKQERLCLR